MELEVLIFKPVAIDGLTTGSIASSEVSSLSHKARNNAVEMAALIVEGHALIAFASFSSSKRCKVFDSLGHNVAEHAKDDAPSWLLINLDVKVYFLGHFSEGLF